MQYECIDDQNKRFITILKKNKDLMKVLNFLDSLNLPNFYIVAGSVFQTIWNYIDGKKLNNNINDIDILYYDKNNLTKEYEEDLERKIILFLKSEGLNYEIDLHNEARMHLWKKANENPNIDYYINTEDTINQFVVTAHAVGITKIRGKIKVYAPYGLSDIFNKTIRPIKHKNNSKELFDKKVKSWSKRFDNLNIINW